MVNYSEVEQRTEEWFIERSAKIGSTGFKDIIDWKTGKLKKETASRTPILTAACKIIAEIETGMPLDIGDGYISPAMEWGEDMEEFIIEKYHNPTYKKIGFVTCDKYKYFGLSPDMLFFKDGEAVQAIEGKGPNKDTFVKYRIKNVIPDEHQPQILSYFCNIPTLKVLMFVAHDPRNNVNPWFEKKITREELQPIINQAEISMLEFETIVDNYLTQLK